MPTQGFYTRPRRHGDAVEGSGAPPRPRADEIFGCCLHVVRVTNDAAFVSVQDPQSLARSVAILFAVARAISRFCRVLLKLLASSNPRCA